MNDASMGPRVAAALRNLERGHGIRVLYACESGSRAWGFPSPDSDYDVRFIYCHPPQWYLSLDEGRDTLEFPIDDELDLSGWELRKTLRLLRGSNAALLEWLQSPVVYHEALHFRAEVQPLLPACFRPQAALHHYLGLVRRGLESDLVGEEVRLKRLFYALRSALAARWIRERHTLSPMEFALLRELLPLELNAEVDELLRRKVTANEKTVVPRPAQLLAFLQTEFNAGQVARNALSGPNQDNPTTELNTLFQHMLQTAF